METLSAVAVWGYQETSEEMKSMLWATVCELEQVRNNVREEMKKKEDFINQLVNLLKTVNQERDEAKEQLQTLLNKLKQFNSVEQQFSADHPFLWPTENPQPNQAWASFITEDSANPPRLERIPIALNWQA
ncbi:hypothetical protein HPP92_012098 [Vanilla planifolia]|uniref:Uncharacterized protein n=1 Tax=Vanilla planifolia TaxID=51239 RepID=A0A835V1M8_VANPL|nr:hypothetical protein HPP92_012471 [Vanilla planifolia]KAG0484014.1 hypothetical protein HPP92_012098 [Vanilla planifolia]